MSCFHLLEMGSHGNLGCHEPASRYPRHPSGFGRRLTTGSRTSHIARCDRSRSRDTGVHHTQGTLDSHTPSRLPTSSHANAQARGEPPKVSDTMSPKVSRLLGSTRSRDTLLIGPRPWWGLAPLRRRLSPLVSQRGGWTRRGLCQRPFTMGGFTSPLHESLRQPLPDGVPEDRVNGLQGFLEHWGVLYVLQLPPQVLSHISDDPHQLQGVDRHGMQV